MGPGWPSAWVRRMVPSGWCSETPIFSMRSIAAVSSSQYTFSWILILAAPRATLETQPR